MFTSLNVVRIAAVDWDWTRRSATRWRSRDIATRCSVRVPGAGGGSRRAGGAWVGEAALSAGAVAAPTTSDFVTRPSRPVPETVAVSTPFSAAILAAEGDSAPPGADFVVDAVVPWAPAFAEATSAVGLAAPATDVGLASVSRIAITSPLVTES